MKSLDVRIERIACVVVALLLCEAVAAGADANAAKLGRPIEFRNAGLRVAFPNDLQRLPPRHPNSLALLARRDPNGRKQLLISLVVSKGGAGTGVGSKRVAEVLAARARKAYAPMGDVSSGDVKVSGGSGWRISGRVTGRGAGPGTYVVAAWEAAFVEPNLALVYGLELLDWRAGANEAMATMDAMLASAKKIAVQAPMESGITGFYKPVTLTEEGVAVSVPLGWNIQKIGRREGSDVVASYGALDYVRNVTAPHFNIVAIRLSAPPKEDPKLDQAYLDDMAEHMRRNEQLKYALITKRLLKVLGKDGSELVGRIRGVNNTSLIQIQVCRQVYHNGTVFTFTLTCPDGTAGKAPAIMDSVLKGIKLLTPRAQPLSKPATGG